MYKKVQSFYRLLGLNKQSIARIDNNISWKSIQKQVKSSIDFILKNHKAANEEVEKKILWIDLEWLIKKLEDYWAEETFDGLIEDNRYDFENHILKEDAIFFRTRETRKKSYITIKKHLDNKEISKDWCSSDNEFELEVNNIEKVIDSILNLWMEEIKDKKYLKHRISYTLKWVHFDFDKYDNIPWFLEIESDNEDDVNYWINKLWIWKYKTVKYWYRKLKELYHLDKAA